MDIISLSMAMSQMNVRTQASIAVTKLSMDMVEQNAEMMTDMMKSMELSVEPHIGASIDVRL